MQPSFYYVTVLMAIALASSMLLLRINNALGPRWRSIPLVAPMVVALSALIVFPPTLNISIMPDIGLLPISPQYVDGQTLPGTAFPPLTGPALTTFRSSGGA